MAYKLYGFGRMRPFKLVLTTCVLFCSLSVNAQSPNPSPASAVQRIVFNQYWQIVMKAPRTKQALTLAEANEIYHAVANHPVAGPNHLDQYDPDGAIGFCFGRSMTAFLLGRQAGLVVPSMHNLFIVGDLRSSAQPEWRFHVTSVVLLTSPEGHARWYAIDPIIPQMRPVPVEEWIHTVRRIWDRAHRAKLYLTSPFQIMPDVRNFAVPAQETGRDIIELKFNPENKPGFRRTELKGAANSTEIVYELSDEAGKYYFLSTNERAPETFPFDALRINNLVFDFHGYFSDLLNMLLNPAHIVLNRN